MIEIEIRCDECGDRLGNNDEVVYCEKCYEEIRKVADENIDLENEIITLQERIKQLEEVE